MEPALLKYRLSRVFDEAPPEVRREVILDQWNGVRNLYQVNQRSLPQPVWAVRDYDDNAEIAWRHLNYCVPRLPEPSPISVYIHIPFCEVKCGFCDCYSLPLGKSSKTREQLFQQALMTEIKAWFRLGNLSTRPVTTVHFGGGTPNALDPGILSLIVRACRNHFGVSDNTEWALETTCRLLNEKHLGQLRDLGFSRLHVGVQTLDEELRKKLGRRENADTVLKRIKLAEEKGFIISADIIFGLPGQRLGSLINTLKELVVSGIHGLSLYRLQISSRNRNFLRRMGAGDGDPFMDYLFFQAGEAYLRSKGFQKNHFTHFALPPDKQLYYRHAQRGEDLLAMGPTADGRFGHYLYRHPEYRQYVDQPSPGLEGGLQESPQEQRVHQFKVALMSASVTRDLFEMYGLDHLLKLWLACGMLESTTEPDRFNLTANGSWFITTMINQFEGEVNKQFN